MAYLKQNEVSGKGKRTKKSKAPTPTPAHADHDCVADAIDGLASIISTYVTQERNGDNAQPLYSTPGGYPVKVALDQEQDHTLTLYLEGEAMESIADSLRRIADALGSKP